MKGAIEFLEKNKILAWLIVILFIVYIFFMSSLPSTKKVAPQPQFITIIYHILVFFVLCFFLLIAFKCRKNFILISFVIFITLFYSLTDEIHQFFVPGRSPSFSDIMLDSIGIFLSTILYSLFIDKA